MLGRALVRELRRQRGQVVSVIAVTALGVLLFVASAGAYLDLRDSYAATRRTLALADVHVDVTEPVTPDTLARVAALPDVAAIGAHDLVDVPVRIGDARVQVRITSLPAHGQPPLDRVLVLAGALPSAGEILVEKHLAQAWHLSVGSTVDVATTTTPQRLRVSGVAVAAEYLWVARDRSDFMPDPAEFGIGWMTRDALAALAAVPPVRHQLLVALRPDRTSAAVMRALGSDAIRATPADELVGVRLLQLDVDGYRGMAAFFPVFFLGVGAFIVAAILARLVDAQRAVVGTLMALGVGRGRILLHYVSYGLVLGGIGALVGVVAGAALSPAMTRAYASELGIPFVTTHVHGGLVAWGELMGLACATLAALMPAIHASRMAPADAMRPPRPSTGALARVARRLRAPLPLQLAIRDLLGRPLRSTATAVGVAAALVVVITTGGLLDSMRVTFGATFERARRDDLEVDLIAPTSPADARARFALPGVTRVEGLRVAPIVLEAGGRTAEAELHGLDDDAVLVRSIDADGTAVPPRPGEIVLTRELARTLHVAVGDRVALRPPGARAVERSLRVGGFADAALGPIASIRRDDAPITSVALSIAPASHHAVRAAIAAAPDVARITDTAAARTRMTELMSLGWVMLGTMLVFGSVLAAAILFSTATLGVLEHRRDLATMRALGRTMRELGLALTLEHALIALGGIAIGVPAARLATRYVIGVFSSDLFHLPYVISPATLAIAIGGVIAVLLLAQWPSLRAVGRMSLADSVRARDG